MRRAIIAALLLLPLLISPLILPVSADEITDSQLEAINPNDITDALDSDTRELMGNEELSMDFDWQTALKKLLSGAAELFTDSLGSALTSAAKIALICLLVSFAEAVYSSVGGANVPNYIPLTGVMAVSAVTLGDVGSFMKLGAETIADIEEFSKALLPSLSAAAAAAGGQLGTASLRYAAAALFMDVIVTASNRLLLPLINCYAASVIADSAFGGDALRSVSAFIKRLTKFILTTLMLCFTAYLGITGIMSGAVGAVTARVTKLLISNSIPIVGGIVSDAASAVIAGAGLVRGTVGVFGMISVCAICLVPFLKMWTASLMYRLAAALAAICSDGVLNRLISGLGDAIALTLAVTGGSAAALFFSIISIIKAVSG